MTIHNCDTIKTIAICVTKKNRDPTWEKGSKPKIFSEVFIKENDNHKANSRLVAFFCTVKQIVCVASYLTDVSLGYVGFLMKTKNSDKDKLKSRSEYSRYNFI